MLRDFLLAASMANLCLIHVWSELLTPIDASSRFSMRLPASSLDFLALILNELILCLVLWSFIQAGRRLLRCSERLYPLLGVSLLALCIVPANGIRTRFLSWRIDILLAALHKGTGKLALGLLPIVAVPLIARRYRQITRWTVACVLVLAPFAGAVAVRAAIAGIGARVPTQPNATAPPVIAPRGGDRPKIVWFVFDGMDQSTSLDGHSEVPMPALKRLKDEAVYAENARPPAGETRLSLPSYLIGRRVVETDRRGDGDLDLLLSGGGTVVWSGASSVFTESRSLGFTTALAGWYLPYCRVIGNQLDYCMSEVYESVVPSGESSLWDRMRLQIFTVDPLNGREQHILRHRRILQAAKMLTADPAYNVIFIHWPVPHYPPVYDATHHRYTRAAYSFTKGYFQNLGLVEDSLKEVRQVMEDAGVWNNATLIVTSDHPPTDSGISDDKRVPFLVKLAGQKRGVAVVEPVNTVVIAEMCLAILRKQVRNELELAAWLTARSRKED